MDITMTYITGIILAAGASAISIFFIGITLAKALLS